MKRYKASDLTHKRAEVIKEAKSNGVIIECRNTNGSVESELVLMSLKKMKGEEDEKFNGKYFVDSALLSAEVQNVNTESAIKLMRESYSNDEPEEWMKELNKRVK